MTTYRISPTTGLNLFRECPKCFWLHYNERVQRPRGIFPSLPGGMDEVIKVYFDKFRGSKEGVPPELKGKVPGVLVPDQQLMNEWRNWRTGLQYETIVKAGTKSAKVTLFGALDECLVEGDVYIPLDYKTRGSAPIDGDSEKYYQTQLDTYASLLSHNGYQVADSAYLVYYYPEKVEKNGKVTFNVKPVEIGVDTARVDKLLETAVKLLLGPMPTEHGRCEYNQWYRLAQEFE